MLNAKNLGLAGGLLWAFSLLILTVICMFTGYAEGFLGVFEALYPGYNISPVGAIIGLAYGFADAFVGLFLLAWIYNKLGGHAA